MLGVDELFIELHRTAVLYYFEVPASNHDLAIERLTEALFSCPPERVPLARGDEAYGSTRLEQSVPRGPTHRLRSERDTYRK